MTDFLHAVVSERNAFPTLSRLAEHDVEAVWADVASFIERQMTMQKGVCISGLGTFTFSQMKLDMGSKYVLIQHPVFLLSEKLSQSHGLKQTKPLAAAGDIPVVPLNFTALSTESLFDRDVVEGCIRETLLLLLRAVTIQRTVVFTFRGIGVLSFHHSNVKMKFYKDFISAMDGTGKLLWALTNRPGTSCSVVSGKLSSLQRPMTSNAILLPRISSGESPREADEDESSNPPAKPNDREEENGKEIKFSAHPKSRLPIAKTNADLFTGEPDAKALPDPVERHAGYSQSPDGAVEQLEIKREEPSSNLSCRGHTRAGQRAQRNVPLYVAEERQREEQEQEKVLLLAEQHKDEQFLQKEQARQEEKRENTKNIAAFNLGIAEALRAKKSAKPSRFEGSYIFSGRPVTPPALLKQRRYMQELMEQMTCRRQQLTQSLRDHKLIDRLHQIQLADEIEKQKSHERHQKKENIKSLQKALNTQLEYRGTGIPARQPDSDGPIFGLYDRAPEALAEQKQRAQRLFQEQKNTANTKRKEALFNRLSEQRIERDMLHRNHKELIADRISRYERLRSLRASLEDTWNRSADLKHHRDLEERAFIRSGSELLIDQCEQYRRCYQCKRKTSNCGESNIWKESHYIPGSRLMV
ncbi:coiled-coil domain-containing protein 81 isoform X3 [Pygocentrus nattereri]|uniref:coiled-coil domain-containing protein 81 isoform X3 n=1 Tax=Pygocentrus nattereri TaxID=42514 RepID=UPI0018917DC2|nr:coiled-coil domain-containing protein 81 isoform X3 [Pygocentrus nattereri]